MPRIGDVAKQFNISNRTLRYWEEEGILKSMRAKNGYRFYDDFNAARIKQIVFLRKLKMPITSIERIFVSQDIDDAIKILISHLENLKQETARHNSLAVFTEKLVSYLQSQNSLEAFFMGMEKMVENTFLTHEKTLQILFSERDSHMSANQLDNVRIVKLPEMMVASYCAESATPEGDCSKVFNKFVLENNLHKRDGYRFFGFNNPSPSEGNPIYGYEMWVTIPNDFTVPEPLVKKQFIGGLYASISTRMNEIGERWQLLYNWCKDNDKYDTDFSFQWLEECCMDFEVFISDASSDREKQLDLLEPIRLK